MQVSSVAWFLYVLSKKLVFMPVDSMLTVAHRDHIFLASFIQQPEIQHLVSRGQIISADLPSQTHIKF